MKTQTPTSVTPEYELYLHDLGNLSVQYLTTSQDKKELERQADQMNFLFEKANQQFKAEVYPYERDELTAIIEENAEPEPCEDCGMYRKICRCEPEYGEDR